MKNTLLFLALLCPILIQAQYFSGASAFMSLPEGDSDKQFYGVLGGTFNLTMNGADGLSVIHHNNPFLYGDFTSGIVEIYGDLVQIEIGPNPASDYLRIYSDKIINDLKYRLVNSLGHTKLVGSLDQRLETLIRMEDMPAGVYFLRLVDQSNAIIKTFPLLINH